MSCIFKSDNVCVRVRTFVRKGTGMGQGRQWEPVQHKSKAMRGQRKGEPCMHKREVTMRVRRHRPTHEYIKKKGSDQ